MLLELLEEYNRSDVLVVAGIWNVTLLFRSKRLLSCISRGLDGFKNAWEHSNGFIRVEPLVDILCVSFPRLSLNISNCLSLSTAYSIRCPLCVAFFTLLLSIFILLLQFNTNVFYHLWWSFRRCRIHEPFILSSLVSAYTLTVSSNGSSR